MQGLVALLDPQHNQQVLELWDILERRFSLKGARSFPYPHLSFTILEQYEPDAVEARLRQIAAGLAPFQFQTAGLGVFTTPEPVIYLAVVRAPALERVHHLLWQSFPPLTAASRYYAPEHWVPHITLAVNDLTRAQLPAVVAYLAEQEYHWEITCDSLTFAVETESGYEFRCGCALAGK